MLSNTCKYAIRAAVYLTLQANEKTKIGIKRISEDLGIPAPFLSKILQLLAKHKLFSSTKGPHGGFGLGQDPSTISLYDIILIIDGDDLFKKCLISLRDCSNEDKFCTIHHKYESTRQELIGLFKAQSIKDLANEMEKTDNQKFVI